jgi:Tfp pilus assembly protein PilF
LARVDGLTVAARTSSFSFKGRETLGIPAIANELGVRHVLEGSVRKSGDSIRITAQLIDSSSNAHLWSESFDRKLTAENVFALQDEIAGAIVGALRESLGLEVGDAAPVAVQTHDVDAYELYLKARALFQARRDLTEADRLLAEAIDIDPEFADAFAIRAAIHEFGGEYGVQLGDERAARARGRAFAERSLALNEKNSLAHAILALSLHDDLNEGRRAGDFETVFAGYERALALDPNNTNAINWQGITYAYVGDNENAATFHRRCMEIDPALAACRSNLAVELISLGRTEEASAVVDASINAGAFAESPGQMILLAELRRRDAFLLVAISIPALRGFTKFSALYDAMIDPREDPAIAAEVRARFIENNASARAYTLLNVLGDYESPALINAHWGDLMRGYRRSPEFKAHMRASGVDVYWRKHGFPPQCTPVGNDDFECK